MVKFLDKHERRITRLLEMLPGLMAWGIILMPVIGGYFIPNVVAYAIFIFIAYWFFKSFKSAFFSILGYVLVNEWIKVDWYQKWQGHKSKSKLDWKQIKHVVIIPNYNESVPKLQQSLDSFARQESNVRKNMLVFLAMEERAAGSHDRAKTLVKKYKNKFGYMTATFHPANLPGEIIGKASNETWAAKEAEKYLSKKNIDMDMVTVTSCDADAQFHPFYFSALTHAFATDKNRYLRFWQSPIFWYNNLHEVPFPIKMLGIISHAIGLSDLQEPSRLIFNYSCYSLSFTLLYKSGYWHTDIIPEDWHLFLQTFFDNKGVIEVEPLYLPTYIDAPQAKTWFGSIKNRYQQCVRHAWGATDIPYAIKESVRHSEIPLIRRVRRVYKMIEHHTIWSTNWFLLTLGATVPVLINDEFSRTSLGYNLPKMAEAVLTICLVALFVMIIVDIMLRPDKAKPNTILKVIKEVAQWITLPIVSLALAGLPGIHAQTMLLFGKRLEYKTTEKV